jgi:tetratricopeptide (TPR) repeat protein
VKSRLLKGILLLAIASIATGVYLWMNPKGLAVGSLKSGHDNSALSKHANKPMPGAQHEKEMLKISLGKHPNQVPALLRLAEIESEDGDFHEAAGHLSKILQAEPDNSDASLELGKVLFQLGDVRGALEQTERILKTHPTHEDALYNMGAIYANIGDRKSAMAHWTRLAALNSNSESAQKAQQMMVRLAKIN